VIQPVLLAAAAAAQMRTAPPAPSLVPTPAATPGAAAAGTPRGPTFCAEWIRQSDEGYDRLTLFRDRTLVWKTSRHGKDELKRETLPQAEIDFYCHFFAGQEFFDMPSDSRSGIAGSFASTSAVTLAREDGSRKTVRFDDLSADTAASASLRSALEGLKGIFLSPLPPASRFTPDALAPGTLLKRFDGAVFRVTRLEKETGFVEITGLTEPYSQFVKIDELRFRFSPPERAP
jgi:hypothetical protein